VCVRVDARGVLAWLGDDMKNWMGMSSACYTHAWNLKQRRE
jgi:hypothetical protein